MIASVSTVLWTVLMTMILTILSNLTISVDRTLSTFGISKQTTILTAKRRTALVRFSQFIYSFKAMNLLLSQFRCLPFNRNHVFIVLQKYRMEITFKLDFLPHTKIFPATPRLCIAKPRQRFRKPFSTAWKTCIASGTCSLDKASVTGCSRRSKRSTTSSSAGFQLSLSCDPNIRKFHTETLHN